MLICFGIGEQKNGRLYLYLKKTNKEPQDIITEIFKLAAPRYCLQPVSSFPRTGILVNEDVDIYDAEKVVWAVGIRLVDCFAVEEDKQKEYELRIGMDATKPMGALLDKYKRTKTKTGNL